METTSEVKARKAALNEIRKHKVVNERYILLQNWATKDLIEAYFRTKSRACDLLGDIHDDVVPYEIKIEKATKLLSEAKEYGLALKMRTDKVSQKLKKGIIL